MGGKPLRFKKHPRYPHQRSEGLTRRGQRRIENLLRRSMNTSNDTSAQPCGCDEGANHLCAWHLAEQEDKESTRMSIVDKITNHFITVVAKTWNFSRRLTTSNDHYSNAAMGLASEAGEAADTVKKYLYHSEKPEGFYRQKLVLELGDVLYYMTMLMELFGITWDEVIDGNKEKLESRHPELGKVTERFGAGCIR